MNLRRYERGVIISSRYFTALAVVGSLVSSLLMFVLGLYDVYVAIWHGLQTTEGGHFGTAAVISVIEGLDRFLIAIVLLYFAYGVYSLFIHPDETETQLAIPAWLRVMQIGQLKQVVAEVIIVVLFVLFLRVALETFGGGAVELSWLGIANIALLPVSIMLLALALRFLALHPKPAQPVDIPEDAKPKPKRTSRK